MKIVISVILIFSLLFNVFTCYASESDVDNDSNVYFTLYDVLNDKTGGALDAFASWYDTTSVDMVENVDTYLVKPLEAVQSSFLAVAQDTLNETTQLLKNSADFMKSVWFNPFTKTLHWNEETYKQGHKVLEDRFLDHYEENVPRGFHKADGSNTWLDGSWVYCFVCNRSDAYFTRLTNGQILMCTSSGASSSWQYHANSGIVINDPTHATNNFDSSSRSGVVILGKSISYRFCNNRDLFRYGEPADFYNKYPPVYSSLNEALEAFYGFTPSSGTRPNGKGFFRPLPKDKEFVSTSNNVINNNWGDIIVKNFTTYGDSFMNTTINNFYYTANSPSTPNYWYDIYDDTLVFPSSADYDLDDITLVSPELVTNNNFLNALFSAFPVALSGLFLALLMLSAVIIFLRG